MGPEISVSRETKEVLKKSRSAVVLTGAGISAESGVPTFRGQGGLWKKFRPEDLATPGAFKKDPKLVWEWYDWRRGLIKPLSPNRGHVAIANFEALLPEFALITQNIDGLHHKAGSKKIIELHGNIWRVRCTAEGDRKELYDVPLSELPPVCECGALLRPDVVWFGEELPGVAIEAAKNAALRAEVFFVVGTSAVVQPAASLPLLAKRNGAYLVEVNTEATPLTEMVDECLMGPAGEILPEIEKLIAEVRKSG